jgi:chromosome segregation ATPase
VELAEANNALKKTTDEYATLRESSAAEADSLRAELSKLRREKEVAVERKQDLEQSMEAARRKFAAAKQEQLGKMQGVESHLRDAQGKIVALEAKLASVRESNVETQSTLQSTRAALERMDRKYAEQAALVETLKTEFKQHVESLAPAYKEQADKLKSKLMHALSKEKKRSDAYKSKALESHAIVKSLSASMHNNNNNENSNNNNRDREDVGALAKMLN